MSKTRAELDKELDQLAAVMPVLMSRHESSDQMDAFAGFADGIEEAAGPDDQEHVWSRLQCILREAGLVPGDDEPCSE